MNNKNEAVAFSADRAKRTKGINAKEIKEQLNMLYVKHAVLASKNM